MGPPNFIKLRCLAVLTSGIAFGYVVCFWADVFYDQ